MSLRMKYHGVRWMLGGVLVIAVAVTQAYEGWVGDGFYFRVVYPILLLLASTVFFWVGYNAFVYTGELPIEPESIEPAAPEAK